MIDLGLNKYKIKEIKYEVKEGKTVIFKFRNFNLEDVDVVLDDVEIVEDEKKCCNKKCNCNTTKVVLDEAIIYPTKSNVEDKVSGLLDTNAKKIKDKFDALALDKSRELMNKIKDVPYKVIEKVGTLYTFDDGVAKYETKEDPYVTNDERETKKQKNSCNTKTEESEAKFSVKDLDKYGPAKHLDDYEPFSCLKGEKGMQEALESSRKKEWKEDVMTKPSSPTPTGNAIVPIDYSEKEENTTVPTSLKEKDEAKLKPIFDAFKDGDKEDKKE